MAGWLVGWTALLTASAGCAGSRNAIDVYQPDSFGPYHVGFRRIEYYDAGRDRILSTAVWYPARKPPHDVQLVYYLGADWAAGYPEVSLESKTD